MSEKGKNSLTDLREFLHTEANPLSMAEFRDFWASLSDEEKEEFKNADLSS